MDGGDGWEQGEPVIMSFPRTTLVTVAIPRMADETVLGPEFRATGLRAPSAEPRPWLKDFDVCPALEEHRIVHVGLARAESPHRVFRGCQTSDFFAVTLSGRVRVRVDGEWETVGPGAGCLLPAHCENAFEVPSGGIWEYVWVCVLEPGRKVATARLARPHVAPWPVGPVRHAVMGLKDAVRAGQSPALLSDWVSLLHSQVLHFCGASRVPDAFAGLWERVVGRLHEAWPLDRLATEAHCSREQLRRLCQREFGRSPHNQVIHLRLRHAARLLATTDWKVEQVSDSVGYANPFVFSLAFKRGMGCSPTEYRLGNRCQA